MSAWHIQLQSEQRWGVFCNDKQHDIGDRGAIFMGFLAQGGWGNTNSKFFYSYDCQSPGNAIKFTCFSLKFYKTEKLILKLTVLKLNKLAVLKEKISTL